MKHLKLRAAINKRRQMGVNRRRFYFHRRRDQALCIAGSSPFRRFKKQHNAAAKWLETNRCFFAGQQLPALSLRQVFVMLVLAGLGQVVEQTR